MRRHIGRAQVNVHITQCVHIHFPSGTRSHIVIPNKIFFDLHRFCLICDSATPGWQLHAIENSAGCLQKFCKRISKAMSTHWHYGKRQNVKGFQPFFYITMPGMHLLPIFRFDQIWILQPTSCFSLRVKD